MRILIVEDGTQRGALAAVRSLGRSGHAVEVASPRRGPSSWSRWCRAWHRVPPSTERDLLVAALRGPARDADLVFPVGDSELLALSEARDEVGAVLPWPRHEVVETLVDKGALDAVAQRAGVAVPRTIPIEEFHEPMKVFVKERVHGRSLGDAAAARTPAVAASTEREVNAAVAVVVAAGGEPMLQEAIDGRLIAYCSLRDKDGNLWAELQQRANAVFPPGAGVSVRAETVPVDPVVAASAGRLLDETGAWGVVEMQFIESGDRPPLLIDVNPRFYGSLALALAAGVDLPRLWVEIAAGASATRPRVAKPGVRYQWLEGDLRRALAERRGGLLRDVASTLSYAPGAAHSIASARDLRPLVRFGAALSRRGAKKMSPWS